LHVPRKTLILAFGTEKRLLICAREKGNTIGMKAAVSIPDEVFQQGERLARRLHTSRSHLYARALSDFVVQHDEDQATAAMNRVIDEVGAETDDFSKRAAHRTLRQVEW